MAACDGVPASVDLFLRLASCWGTDSLSSEKGAFSCGLSHFWEVDCSWPVFRDPGMAVATVHSSAAHGRSTVSRQMGRQDATCTGLVLIH